MEVNIYMLEVVAADYSILALIFSLIFYVDHVCLFSSAGIRLRNLIINKITLHLKRLLSLTEIPEPLTRVESKIVYLDLGRFVSLLFVPVTKNALSKCRKHAQLLVYFAIARKTSFTFVIYNFVGAQLLINDHLSAWNIELGNTF